MRNKPEVLAPANSLEVLKTAVEYGADAVYIGGEMYGLRAKAKNFSAEDMKKGIAYAHERGKKVYVTANITAHNRDLEGVRAYFHELKEIRPDALIISDPGVFTIAKEVCPEIDIHISTQSNNVNYMTFRFWKEQGATRVVTARELSLEEIAQRFYLSKYYVCRLFKEVTGYSINEYINIHRVQKAQWYLTETDLSISEIAGQIGFGSMTHFEKIFKTYTTMTPLKYRKSGHIFAPSELPMNP